MFKIPLLLLLSYFSGPAALNSFRVLYPVHSPTYAWMEIEPEYPPDFICLWQASIKQDDGRTLFIWLNWSYTPNKVQGEWNLLLEWNQW